ncbi:MAG TPA: PP2C family protein-serine/threonine phosphatase [Thermoanaerobaculia bacterium]
MPTKRNPTLPSLLALAAGVLVFAGGVTLARSWLPEWRSGPLPAKAFYAGRFQELAQRVGARLAGEPRVFLSNRQKDLEQKPRLLDPFDAATAVALGGGVLVEVREPAVLPGAHRSQELIVDFLPSGDPWSLRWGAQSESIKVAFSGSPGLPPAQQTALTRLLLRPGETLGAPVPSTDAKGIFTFYPIPGSRPLQRIATTTTTNSGVIVLQRQIGDTSPENTKVGPSDFASLIWVGIPLLAGICTVVGGFLVLLGRRRIDLAGGLKIAGLLLAVAAAGILVADPTWTGALTILGAFFLCLWAFLMWSTGESFLRAVMPAMMPELDTLRAGRLGQRGGRALVQGIAFGAILAGFRLAALAVAARLPGLWPEDPNPELPIFRETTPFFHGVVLAAGIALALGLAYRFLPSRWAPWAAAVAAGLAIPFVPIHPAGWHAAAGAAAGLLLVLAGRRAGLAAILTAALCAELLPAAAFSGLFLSWLPGSFAVCSGFPLLLLALGVVGMGRPEQAEMERLKQPAFIRRLEEERRISYEMDLLARMQLGLLPSSLPVVPGWEIAVRSLLATEAGGDLYDFLQDETGNLWIAAGDVAGHGYSCAIVQAMTAAALTSIITPERTPSEVLQGVDRVIRRGGSHRNFTSLALVRLDPETGKVTMSNAGHPFPLLLAHDGEVEEINLPGLPLGQGPQRRYADFSFEIPPGGALVFCSDGLFEATDPHEAQYGYERPRDLLRKLGDYPAPGILAALLDDWRAYMRSDDPPADDTTVLVLKRL